MIITGDSSVSPSSETKNNATANGGLRSSRARQLKHYLSRPVPRAPAGLTLLLILLACLYAFAYSGRIESGDALILLDAASSQFHFGDWLLDESARPLGDEYTEVGMVRFAGEKLQPILAMPIYAIGWLIPGIGLVHTTWLFNIIITLALIAVFYAFCRALGYDDGLSLLAGALLGAATILLPYSKTFFREPLAALLLLLVALFLEWFRARNYKNYWLAILALGAILLAINAKESALLVIPGLLCLLAPEIAPVRQNQRNAVHLRALNSLLDYLTVLLLLLALVFCLIDLTGPFSRIAEWLRELGLPFPWRDWEYFREALASQLLSPGASFWGSSPILLLALPGALKLWRSGKKRILRACALILLAYAIGHALRGPHWFGGLSWPPRNLLPTIPFIMLLALPTLQSLLRHRRRLALVGAAILLLYSLWWQVTAVALRWEDLPLPAEANGLLEWSGARNSLPNLRPILVSSAILRNELPVSGWDFGWWRAGADFLPIFCFMLAGACAHLLWKKYRNNFHLARWQFTVLSLGALALLLAAPAALRHDPLYAADRLGLREILPIIENETDKGDIVFVTQEYRDFILNHYTGGQPRFIVLEHQPGESYHPEIAPALSSATPRIALSRNTLHRLNIILSQTERFFFLADGGPFLPWRPRVLERYFAERAYLIQEFETAPDVRLLEYAVAPIPGAQQDAVALSQIRFGDALLLEGLSLPDGNRYAPGAALPLAAQWRVIAPLSVDYTISWKLARNGRVVMQGSDGQPGAGFDPTSGWQAGISRWDLRALRLPAGLMDGEYELWLEVYHFVDGEILPLPAQGGAIRNATIAVLPQKIRILPTSEQEIER